MKKVEKEASAYKEIVDIMPVGTQVLIEVLTAAEKMNTSLHITTTKDTGAPQGYILKIGPKVDEAYGLAVGQRVLLSGSFVPAPKNMETGREVGLFEPFCIKAVLVEG